VLRDEPPPGRKLAPLPSAGILVRDCGTSKSEAHIRYLRGTGKGRAGSTGGVEFKVFLQIGVA